MANSIVRRALLYVPGSSIKFLEKSRGLTVDCIAYDLEDSVTPSKKVESRKNLRELLGKPRAPGIREQAVRINAVETGLAEDDLKEVVHSPYSYRSRPIQLCFSFDHVLIVGEIRSYKRPIWTPL